MGYYQYYPDKRERDQDEGLIEILKHNLKGDKKCFLYTYYEGHGTNGYHVREFWTAASREILAQMGYKKSDGFLEKLAYSFTKCYVKLEGFYEAEPTDLETAESLRNMLESNAINNFKRGFAKTTMHPLEMKQILFMIPIVIGLILGIFLLMGGM